MFHKCKHYTSQIYLNNILSGPPLAPFSAQIKKIKINYTSQFQDEILHADKPIVAQNWTNNIRMVKMSLSLWKDDHEKDCLSLKHYKKALISTE